MNASPIRTARRRWSAAEQTEILRAHAQRRQTQAQFCRSRGLSVPTLHNWLRQRSGKFVEITAPAPASLPVAAQRQSLLPAAAAAVVTIELAGGLTVQVPVGCEVRWVGQLIGALRCGV